MLVTPSLSMMASRGISLLQSILSGSSQANLGMASRRASRPGSMPSFHFAIILHNSDSSLKVCR
jgi:hypothetical protein